MGKYTQTAHLLTIDTALGKDAVMLTGFSGQEAISRPFHYQLTLVSENDAIAPADIVGSSVTWAVNHVHSEPRYFNGHVIHFTAAEKTARELRAYRVEVVPWLWFLTRTANCRIFQQKTAVDIIKQVFDDLGLTDYQVQITRDLVKRDYCVQYRETAFAFVSRLMEEEGIFYFFKHEQGKHTLVLADAKSSYVDCLENEVEHGQGAIAQNHISHWEHQYSFCPGKWAQTDYNFETPSTALLTKTETVVQLPRIASFEMFDYPGKYSQKSAGTHLTKIRMEEDEASHDVVTGASSCCTFVPGGKFNLATHACSAEQQAYVLTRVTHTASEPAYDGGGYSNTFTCIPAKVTFRPERTTPRPLVQGPQTAVVVGPSGQEVYTDKYGRIKVHFFWDRASQADENSSCWVRVAELWAGKQWGTVFHPRIGQEVVVEFLEGDPDRPLITGRVYNNEQMPPYALPDNQTQSGVKSRSTKNGSADNFSELRFEDKKGSEEVYFHAEKDFKRVVENNDTLKVGSDQADDGSQTVTIWKDRSVTIAKGKDSLEVQEGDRLVKIDKGKHTLTVKDDRTVTVESGADIHEVKEGDCTVKVDKGNHTLTVKGDHTVTVKEGKEVLDVKQGDRTVTVAQGKDTHQIKMGDRTVKIDMGKDTLTISMGDQTTKVEMGKIESQAMQSIELKVGQNSIKLEQSGITIKGMQVKIEGTIQAEVKGTLATVKADGLLTLKGGMTMIN
jgi:type VI secretion system secreted protein VgrG